MWGYQGPELHSSKKPAVAGLCPEASSLCHVCVGTHQEPKIYYASVCFSKQLLFPVRNLLNFCLLIVVEWPNYPYVPVFMSSVNCEVYLVGEVVSFVQERVRPSCRKKSHISHT